jgi:exopolyphosphatase/guanosine-5'-triphosphate,3'-diphosphate pyrophosphatase
MAQTNYPLSVMHNYRINADDALKFAALLDHQSKLARRHPRHIEPRRETIPWRSRARAADQADEAAHVVVSVFGIREGLLTACSASRRSAGTR